ncbi:hypothetical protein CONPUDRAFT_135515 [Coniophora puteana RWD-64-598 SS2]|uniref:DUF6593 domain-containing protein n=1 Tax=Coniophora puteana (strain RWD-64-598) TaxID=741705 RepID=A0A5M3MYF8_CONPW|nr:uncharacterized protein CONPUDRAFT_135515 [Coniophora puteana RWD-64-598 SS2]EIW83814.1 hypothetical protein CONPUDRAFT_135515 [Coniophora puteana RWD-64-598 SS2]
MNSMRSTTLFQGSRSNIVYTVRTDTKTGKRTELCNGQGNVIAVWTRRDILPDTISWPQREGMPSMTVNKWLWKTQLPDKAQVHAVESPHGKLVWRTETTGHRHAVYLSPRLSRPIAYFTPKTEATSLALVLDSSAEPTRDDIVLSALILEHRLRTAYNAISAVGAQSSHSKSQCSHSRRQSRSDPERTRLIQTH